MKVTQTPLASLRSEAGTDLHRVRDLVTDDLKKMLSLAVVQFVVAEIGKPLRWVSEEERFRCWKSEVHSHIADEAKKSLDDSPAGYFYFASEWRSEARSEVIVLLEKHH